MEPLALLCTLHADGPVTLQALREAGCTTLRDLEQLESERLTKVLGGKASRAVRFLAEASALMVRQGEGLLEVEVEVEVEVEEQAGNEGAAPSRVDDEGEGSSQGTPPVEEKPEGAARPVIAAVLDAWRSQEPEPQAPEVAPVEPERLAGSAGQDRTSLESCALEGVDEFALELLGKEGITSLHELIGADPLQLSERTGLGFTHHRRLQYLAGRLLAELGPERPPEAVAGSGGDAPEDSGGPFA